MPDVPALPDGQLDDGPWPKTTEALLTAWPSGGSRPPFFLVGEQVADHQDLSGGWRMRPSVGLHTWHHVSLQGMTREETQAQLGKTQQTIQAVVARGG